MANLPAEIAHLLEEIQAKDRVVQECRNVIATRDGSIQKFLKLNGAGQPNPKEEGYCKNVMPNFDKAQIVQEEKVGLSEKAALLVESSPSVSPLSRGPAENDNFISLTPPPPSPARPPNQTPRLQNPRPPKRRRHPTGPATPLPPQQQHPQHTPPAPLVHRNRRPDPSAPSIRQRRRPLHHHRQQPHLPPRPAISIRSATLSFADDRPGHSSQSSAQRAPVPVHGSVKA